MYRSIYNQALKYIKTAISFDYCRNYITFAAKTDRRKKDMTKCEGLILTYASNHKVFGKKELQNHILGSGIATSSTISCTLTKLMKAGELIRVSRGQYSLPSNVKISFRAEVTENEIKINELLKKQFPFATFCIYNGRSLSSLQHHISENNTTYIETEHYAIESVFEFLKAQGYKVWLNPSEDISYLYIDLKENSIIVKPLVTEAPMESLNGTPVPTLEKILVDIEKDPCFYYLHGAEAALMRENAREMYIINNTRLKRYAQRRGLKL